MALVYLLTVAILKFGNGSMRIRETEALVDDRAINFSIHFPLVFVTYRHVIIFETLSPAQYTKAFFVSNLVLESHQMESR